MCKWRKDWPGAAYAAVMPRCLLMVGIVCVALEGATYLVREILKRVGWVIAEFAMRSGRRTA